MKSFSFISITVLTFALILATPSHAICRFSHELRTFVPPGCLPTPKDLPDCSVCKAASECLSGICLRNRCVQDNPTSHRNCFGPTGLPECAECWKGPECETGLCLNQKCASLTRASVRKCFRRGRCFRDMSTLKRVCLPRRNFFRRFRFRNDDDDDDEDEDDD